MVTVAVSFLYGNIGMREEKKEGIFIMTGPALHESKCEKSANDYSFIAPGIINNAGLSTFLSSDARYTKKLDNFIFACYSAQKPFPGTFLCAEKKKWQSRCYTEKIAGLSRMHVLRNTEIEYVKVIVRNKNGVSRMFLFETGLDPSKGGHTWFLTPDGIGLESFTTKDTRPLLASSEQIDNFLGARFLAHNPLFLAITNAYPVIGGTEEFKEGEFAPSAVYFKEKDNTDKTNPTVLADSVQACLMEWNKLAMQGASALTGWDFGVKAIKNNLRPSDVPVVVEPKVNEKWTPMFDLGSIDLLL